MTKTQLQNLRLGIFVVLGTTLLLFAAYLIGNRQNMFGKTFEVSAVFKNATGLQNGNNVRFSGINVGTINDIEMINDTTIRVHMIIENEMLNHIKKNAIVSIGSDGLVGSMLINIVPSKNASELIKPGDELQSYNKIGAQDMLSTLNVTNENAALLTADLLKVSQSLTEGKGALGKLLNDTTMGKDLKQTITNLKYTSNLTNTTFSQLNEIIESIDLKESALGILLTDTVSAKKMKTIIVNLETSSFELEKMSKDLKDITGGAKEGKGVINYLSQDTTLVRQLERTVKSIEEGTERFNENMEALKHNFLTRGYFKKQEKQQKKKSKEIP